MFTFQQRTAAAKRKGLVRTDFSHLASHTRRPALVHVHAAHMCKATARKEYSNLPWVPYIKQAFTPARKQIIWCTGIGMSSMQKVDRNTLIEPLSPTSLQGVIFTLSQNQIIHLSQLSSRR